MIRLILISTLCLFCTLTYSQSITGKWKTIDPFTNKPSSIVEMFFKDGKLHGKFVSILDVENPEKAICEDCPEPWKNKPLIGLVILRNLERKGNKWVGKDAFFSRKTKKTYDGAVWLEGNKLNIQIKIGPVKFSRKWIRASSPQ